MIDPGPVGLAAAGSGLPWRRRLTGVALAVVVLPVLTIVLTTTRDVLSLSTVLLVYLLAVVVVTAVGGAAVGLAATAASALCANYYFTHPFHTFRVRGRDEVVALATYVGVAVVVSALVEISARRRAAAVRADIEARALERIAQAPVEQTTVADVLEEIRRTFGFDSVSLVDAGGHLVSTVGSVHDQPADVIVEAGRGLQVVGSGPEVVGRDRRLLATMSAAAVRALDAERLSAEAGQARELAEIDRVRSALLAAVGHDLRTPLAGIKAAVSSLRQDDVDWSEEARAELLATVEESADELGAVVDNLLDMTRLRAGVLSVDLRGTALDAVVAGALLGDLGRGVHVEVPDDLPLVAADAGLLERVVANLVANAVRFSPPGRPPSVVATAGDGYVDLRVVDHGPGIAPADRERVFEAFQRLDDRSRDTGLGLGLAISRGFVEAQGGSITPEETAGGGLTMTVRVPVWRPS